HSPRKGDDSYCFDCGFVFPEEEPIPVAQKVAAKPSVRLKGRYELKEFLSERSGVARYRGLDFVAGDPGIPVVILKAAGPASAEPFLETAEVVTDAADTSDEEVLPSFDIPVAQPLTDPQLQIPIWPNLAWEKAVLEAARHPALPSVVDNFVEDGSEYLVETSPAGVLLWDAWDDPDASAEQRFGYLKHIAEGLRALHQAGAMLESLRPEI